VAYLPRSGPTAAINIAFYYKACPNTHSGIDECQRVYVLCCAEHCLGQSHRPDIVIYTNRKAEAPRQNVTDGQISPVQIRSQHIDPGMGIN
jgi:hypothetical protein